VLSCVCSGRVDGGADSLGDRALLQSAEFVELKAIALVVSQGAGGGEIVGLLERLVCLVVGVVEDARWRDARNRSVSIRFSAEGS
jgi:hypothetical protein